MPCRVVDTEVARRVDGALRRRYRVSRMASNRTFRKRKATASRARRMASTSVSSSNVFNNKVLGLIFYTEAGKCSVLRPASKALHGLVVLLWCFLFTGWPRCCRRSITPKTSWLTEWYIYPDDWSIADVLDSTRRRAVGTG